MVMAVMVMAVMVMAVMVTGMVVTRTGVVDTGAVTGGDGAVGGVQASASLSPPAITDAAAGLRTTAIIPAATATAGVISHHSRSAFSSARLCSRLRSRRVTCGANKALDLFLAAGVQCAEIQFRVALCGPGLANSVRRRR
jgi:hypothetical protein